MPNFNYASIRGSHLQRSQRLTQDDDVIAYRKHVRETVADEDDGDAMVFQGRCYGSAGFRDGSEPRAGGPGGFPHFEDAGKFDPFDVPRRLALEAPHQEAPGSGGEILDRLRDRRQVWPQREHPVEVVKADDRHVARDFEPEAARGLN